MSFKMERKHFEVRSIVGGLEQAVAVTVVVVVVVVATAASRAG